MYNYIIWLLIALYRVNTKDIIKILINPEDLFDLNNLIENHEIFSSKNTKSFEKTKLETPINLWIEELLCLRSKMYAFKDGVKINGKLFLNLSQKN